MAKQLEDGTFESVIDLGDGSGTQTFKGKTLEELTQKLENAQLNATRKIRSQQKTINEWETPETAEPLPEFKPRKLDPNELFKLGQDLTDPTRAEAAVEQIITARVGATPDQIREGLKDARINRLIEKYRADTQEFIGTTPEYKATENNKQALLSWLEKEGIPPSLRNLKIAFNRLVQEGGFPDGINDEEQNETAPPAQEEERIAPRSQERIAPGAPVTRPRGSSGLRSQHSSAPGPAPVRAKWTKQQVLAMGVTEYERNMKDPAFRKFVDSM